MRCLKDHSSAFTGTAGISWTPDDKTLVYGRYNRGYKAFGFNAGFIGANAEAAPEHVDDFEVGFKKTMGNFVLDADAFYYNYKDAQIPIGVPVGAVTVTEFINIPKAVSKGVEFTAIWNPIEHLNLSLVYGFDYTRISSGCAPGGRRRDRHLLRRHRRPARHGARAPGRSGRRAPRRSAATPCPRRRNKVAFNANYTFVFDPGSLTLSGSYIWKDKSYALDLPAAATTRRRAGTRSTCGPPGRATTTSTSWSPTSGTCSTPWATTPPPAAIRSRPRWAAAASPRRRPTT